MIWAWAPLLAADWTQLIIWVVVISIGIINQMLGANKRSRRNCRDLPMRAAQEATLRRDEKTLLDEVEKFLQEARKATAQSHNRPAQQQPQPSQQQQRPQQQPRPQQQAGRPQNPQQKQPKQNAGKKKNQQNAGQQRRDEKPQRRSLAEQSRLKPQDAGEVEASRLGGSVDRYVQDHINTNRFAERAGRLSHLEQTVDTDIGGHVHAAFDHQVGSLKEGSAAGSTSDDTPTGPNQVVQLVAMLRDPMSMRNAVLMREILEPPSHRW